MTADCHHMPATPAELITGRSRFPLPFLGRTVCVVIVALAAATGDAAMARIGRLPRQRPRVVTRRGLCGVLPAAAGSAVRTVSGWRLLAARHSQRSCWYP